jgi:hypothetical protein
MENIKKIIALLNFGFKMQIPKGRQNATGYKIYKCGISEAFEASLKALEEGGFQITRKGDTYIEAISPFSIWRGRGILYVTFLQDSKGVKVSATAYSRTRWEWLDLGKFKGILLNFFSLLDAQMETIIRKIESSERALREEVIIQKVSVVKIKCQYCGNVYDENLDRCPYCGRTR